MSSVITTPQILATAAADLADISETISDAHAAAATVTTGLIPAAQDLCKVEGLEAVFDTDPFYGRTDSYNFAKKGIPIVFFFSGIHEDYHKSTDDFDKADLDKAARVARAAFRLGWRTAQDEAAPAKIAAPDDSKADGEATVDEKTSP